MNRNNQNIPLNILLMFSGDLWAGAEVMVFNLLSQLVKYSNIRITALSLNEGILSQKLRKLGIKVFIIPEEKYSFPVILLKARKILKGLSINIIHSHRYKENLLALFLSKLLGVKSLITTIHGLSELKLQGKNRNSLIHMKTKMDYFIIKTFFTRVIAVSREMQRILTDQYGFKEEQISVIHNGIVIPQYTRSTDELRNQSTDRFFHIGTAGRLTPVKDYSLFLDIVAEIGKKRKDVRFYILGDGPLKSELQNRMLEMNLEDCVAFLEPVRDPFPFYRSIDLYLNTSRNEGIPLTILEAMASGLPVVAPRVGGIPEIISDKRNGILIDDRDPGKYADACTKLLDNQKMRHALISSGTETIKNKFNSKEMSEAYLRVYELIG